MPFTPAQRGSLFLETVGIGGRGAASRDLESSPDSLTRAASQTSRCPAGGIPPVRPPTTGQVRAARTPVSPAIRPGRANGARQRRSARVKSRRFVVKPEKPQAEPGATNACQGRDARKCRARGAVSALIADHPRRQSGAPRSLAMGAANPANPGRKIRRGNAEARASRDAIHAAGVDRRPTRRGTRSRIRVPQQSAGGNDGRSPDI